MELTPIDVINKTILISVFLTGMLVGAVISLIVSEITKPRRKD
jgi:hypothetical protein